MCTKTISTQLDGDACEFMSFFESTKEFTKAMNIDVSARIKYYGYLAVRKDEEPLVISFDDIDKFSCNDFQTGFNEVIINEDYVHLYFDFGQIQITDDLENVFEWLVDLTNTFGKYSYGGYTDNEEVQNVMVYGFTLKAIISLQFMSSIIKLKYQPMIC